MRRSDLAYVSRRQDARCADRETADDAIDHEFGRGTGNPGPIRADDEKGRRDQQCPSATQNVRQTSRDECTDRAAEQHGGDIEAGSDIVRIESDPQAVHRPVDDAAIETEKETAQCGNGHDRGDQRHIGAGMRIVQNSLPSSCCCTIVQLW